MLFKVSCGLFLIKAHIPFSPSPGHLEDFTLIRRVAVRNVRGEEARTVISMERELGILFNILEAVKVGGWEVSGELYHPL